MIIVPAQLPAEPCFRKEEMAKSEAPVPVAEEHPAETMLEWARANSNKLSIAGIVVVAAAAVGLLWRASAEKKEVRASQALGAAQSVVQSGNAALAQSDLTALIRRYGGTSAATQARLLLAQVHFGQGKVDEGLKELDAVGASGVYGASVHALKAGGLEQAAKLAEAAAEYEKAAAAATTALAKASFQSDAARAYRDAGNKEAAKRIWEAIASDDSNPLAGEARVRLGELTTNPIGS
jgi:predicted negative regulator of RcsB-dependent stress response